MYKKCKIYTIFTLVVIYFAVFALTGVNLQAFASGEDLTSARGMCVMETSSGRVLYSKNLHEKMPMASTTKIITAISVLSKIDDIDTKTVIPKQAIKIPGTSIYLEDGESLTVRELLYGLMLRSGNDAAVALAIVTFGSEQEFLDYTNEFVKTLGAFNTKLENPHGLDKSGHFTTPYDLALITSYALKNKTFAEIVKTKEKVISKDFDKDGNKRLLKNKNKLLSSYPYADGVKTGYTGKAGRSFVGSATKDGMQVVSVVLNCRPMFEESEQLLNRAFSEYKLVKVLDRAERGVLNLEGTRDAKTISTINHNEYYYPLKEDEVQDVSISTKFDKMKIKPNDSRFSVGLIEVKLGKDLIFSDKIYTIKEVNENNIMDNVKEVIEKFIL